MGTIAVIIRVDGCHSFPAAPSWHEATNELGLDCSSSTGCGVVVRPGWWWRSSGHDGNLA